MLSKQLMQAGCKCSNVASGGSSLIELAERNWMRFLVKLAVHRYHLPVVFHLQGVALRWKAWDKAQRVEEMVELVMDCRLIDNECPPFIAVRIHQCLGFTATTDLCCYLGVPLLHNRIARATHYTIVERLVEVNPPAPHAIDLHRVDISAKAQQYSSTLLTQPQRCSAWQDSSGEFRVHSTELKPTLGSHPFPVDGGSST
ncbi:hypothetical protein Ancab_021536 [Ancistrocladus abbreviatus]